jgi:hypothetical protein
MNFLITTTLLKLVSIVFAKNFFYNSQNIYTVSSNHKYNIVDTAIKENIKNDTAIDFKNNFIFSTSNQDTINLNFMQFIDKNNILIETSYKDANINNNQKQLIVFNTENKQANTLFNTSLAIENIKLNTNYNLITFVINNTIYGYNLNNNTLIIKYKFTLPDKIVDIALNYNAQLLATAYNSSFNAYNITSKNLTTHTPPLLFKQDIKDVCINTIVFSPTKNFLVIQGQYLHPTSYLNSKSILYDLTDSNNPQIKHSFSSIDNVNKLLFSTIEQLIVTSEKHYRGTVTLMAHNWMHLNDIQWNRVYRQNNKVIHFTIASNQDILAFITSDNYIKFLKMAVVKYKNNNNYYFETSELISQQLCEHFNFLSFNNDTSKLALLGNNNLQLYSLNLTKHKPINTQVNCRLLSYSYLSTTVTTSKINITNNTNTMTCANNAVTVVEANTLQYIYLVIVIILSTK